jgi:hypothetical protein
VPPCNAPLLKADISFSAWAVRHPAPQVDHRGRRDRAQPEQHPPGDVVAGSGSEQGKRDQRSDDQAERLGGEHEPDQFAPVLAVGVLGHDDGAYRVVAADAEPEQEAEADQDPVGRRDSGSQRRHHHDRRYQPVHVLPADQVGDSPEDEGTKAGSAEHRGVQQRQPVRAELPLQADQRRGDPDDEQIVRIGEKTHPGHHDGAEMEPAERRLIQRGDQVIGWGIGHSRPL